MIFNKLEEEINQILIKKPKIVLGLSGGPDSVFLFHFLKNLANKNKIEFIAALLDHEWRKESKDDLVFCENLCKKNNIILFSTTATKLCTNFKSNGSKEELGRKLRRFFLEDILKKENADFIALAHHLQDQEETFFWRIIRGTTLAGITCMKKIDHPYLRPLLNINKQEILDYLNSNNIEYILDKTNTSDKFLRNRIRKYVLPALKKCDDRFDKKFKSTFRHLQKENLFLNQITKESFNMIFKKTLKNDNFVGNLKSFLNKEKVLQKRILIYWLIKQKIQFNPSESFLDESLRFLNSQNGGSHQLSNSWKLHKKKNFFWIKTI